MNVTPIRWLGRSRADAVLRTARARADVWAQGWCSAQSVDIVQADASDRLTSMRWSGVQSDRGSLRLALHSDQEARIGAWLMGTPAGGDDGLAGRIGIRALREFAGGLLGGVSAETALTEMSAPGEREMADRAGGMLLRCTFGQANVLIHLDAAACDALAPREAPAATTLVPRREALGNSDVQLKIVLDLGKLALRELGTLQTGQILRTSVPLDAQLKLMAGDGKTVRTGVLAAHGDARALRIK